MNVFDAEVWLRLAVALAAGAVVGWEREARRRPAGLRTHVLVALGAAAFTLVGVEVSGLRSDLPRTFGTDPLRVTDGVVGGVGFLGAGAILRAGGRRIRGLTTASGIWAVAAAGVACGYGAWSIVVPLVVMMIFTLAVLRPLEHKWIGTVSGDDFAGDEPEAPH